MLVTFVYFCQKLRETLLLAVPKVSFNSKTIFFRKSLASEIWFYMISFIERK
jgi:hypothetical protein